MYGCRGMLRWALTGVFFRLPMRRRMAMFIRSRRKLHRGQLSNGKTIQKFSRKFSVAVTSSKWDPRSSIDL